MPVDSIQVGATRDSERTQVTSAESLRVRCPHCRKLYMVQFSDIQEAKPRFECVQCRQRFWLSLADQDLGQEVTGLPVQLKDAPVDAGANAAATSKRKTEPCPKCFKANEVSRVECAHCGVVIEKARAQSLAMTEGVPPHSAILATLWKKVVADYADEAQHAEFLRACQRERNLAYAAAQYAQMQRLVPGDETTERRVREVEALASTMVPSIASPVRVPRRFPRLWHLPLMFATIVIISGMLAPVWRNLVGVGAAFLFLAIGLRLHFRRR